MFLFIAAPLISVFMQSFYLDQPVMETVEIENCTPGFPDPICTTETRTRPALDDNGQVQTVTRFVGLESYRNVIQPGRAWAALSTFNINGFLTIEFWKALRFTLTTTLVTLPLVVGVGLLIAITVNNTVRAIRGPIIFVSLLPFIITPVVGALSIKWLFIGDGIMTAFLEWWLQRDIAMFAQGWTIEILLLFYRVWHVAPFAFRHLLRRPADREPGHAGERYRRRRQSFRTTALRDRASPDAADHLHLAHSPDGRLSRL